MLVTRLRQEHEEQHVCAAKRRLPAYIRPPGLAKAVIGGAAVANCTTGTPQTTERTTPPSTRIAAPVVAEACSEAR